MLVATRVGERGEAGLLEQLGADPVARVRVLEPLGAAAVAALVRERLPDASDGFCRRCLELTAGNPLQVRELLLAIEHVETPDGEESLAAGGRAGGALARPLGAAAARRAVAGRAVAGARRRRARGRRPGADGGRARRRSPPADALAAAEELGRADVLRAGDPLGFTHPLVRAAIYGRLPLAEREQIHRRAARLLADGGAPEQQVSAHLLQTLPAADDVVVAVLRAAAQRALAQGAPHSAVDYLDRALREPPPEPTRARVLAELGRAEAVAGRPEAVAHLEAAVALVAEPAERAALLLAFGRALHHAGRLDEASAAFQRGLDELGADASELAMDLEGAYLTSAMHTPSRAADAHRRGEAILADLRLDSRADRELASTAMMMQLFAGRPHDEVLAVARAPRYRGPRRRGRGRRLADAAVRDRHADLVRRLPRRRRRAGVHVRRRPPPRLGAAGSRWPPSCAPASCCAPARSPKPPPTPAPPSTSGATGSRCTCTRPPTAWSPRCSSRTSRTRPPPRSRSAISSSPPRRSSPPSGTPRPGGSPPTAVTTRHALEAFLAAGRGLTELLTVNPAVLPWRSEAGLAAQRLGRDDEARSLIEEEVRLAERFGAPRAIGVAGRAAALLERGEAAVDRLRAAAETLGACGAHVEHARALVDLGVAIRRAGRAGPARETLRSALALAETTGAVALARRAREELRIAGGRARPAAGTAGGLTPSEHRVAELAAAGQTNRQIADALFLTVKSVEWHLGNTYRKLDIRGRGELAERLA